MTELEGLLNAYRLATAPQEGVWSPIEAERQELRANEAAREIADLLARADAPLPVLV
ncbi:hypothetical protein GCM10010172_07250 [Paractinoplanes ferrugineus]|uniref:Uncharacterized protein n=1 Tax=Paractinoplanes ferrugineus TaxID=113564 RepID=A0A919J8H8_9ACTN|nr:hypothetical protein [Actinoplanes ferrugineus]GIE16796.1 hypothetical protein Afe05nite_86360 [Actinoplanes ferrugineus]